MKIKRSGRRRGMAEIGGIIIICLLLVFVLGFFMLIMRAIHRIDKHNIGGGNEATNDMVYTGPGLVVWQATNIVQVPDGVTLAEDIQFSTNLMSWSPLTNIVLQNEQVFDWTTLIDKSKPCGFFKITIYGTNN